MAYSPLAQAGRLRNGLLKNAVVNEIAHAHNISAAQVLLAWVISHHGVMAIPKACARLPMSNKMQLRLRSNFRQRN